MINAKTKSHSASSSSNGTHMARFFFASIIPNIDRVLFIDNNVLVASSILLLFGRDMVNRNEIESCYWNCIRLLELGHCDSVQSFITVLMRRFLMQLMRSTLSRGYLIWFLYIGLIHYAGQDNSVLVFVM